MDTFIFSISIIPVQDFISEATRSRDLKAGSALLSWLTAKVLYCLERDLKAKIKIPSLSITEIKELASLRFEKVMSKSNYSIPNRASGYCEQESVKKLDADLSLLTKSVITNAWAALADDIIKSKYFSDQFIDNYCSKTDEVPFQFNWAIIKKEMGNTYQEDMEIINQHFLNIKRTRLIKPWNGAPIAKCTQCGKRESIGPTKDIKIWREWLQKTYKKSSLLTNERYVDENERLCSVCFTKRLGSYLTNVSITSTNTIASKEWLYKVKQVKDLEKILFAIQMEQKELDPQDNSPWFYSSIISKIKSDEAIKNSLQEKQQKLKEKIVENNIGLKKNPSNYLAVIVFDGDKMGKHSIKEEIASKITQFAQNIIELYTDKDNGPEIFYIGGDEGLLLSPLETVIETAISINDTFTKIFMGEPTLSMGISIFHRERPLGAAIRLAHTAVASSKSNGRNALSINVQTASGNVFRSTSKWGNDWKRINNIIRLIQEQKTDKPKLSSSWSYEIEKYFHTLPQDQWGQEDFRNAVKNEVKRITFRKTKITQNHKNQKENIWQNIILGEEWFVSLDSDYYKELLTQMHLMAFFAREGAFDTKQIDNNEEMENE